MRVIFAALLAVLLTAVFYLVFTPVGLVMRLFGKDPLRHLESKSGFWRDRSDDDRSPARMRRKY